MSVFDDKNKKRTSMSDDIFSLIPVAKAITKALGMPTPSDDIKKLKGYSDSELENMDKASLEKLRNSYKKKALIATIIAISYGGYCIIGAISSLADNSQYAKAFLLMGIIAFVGLGSLGRKSKKNHDKVDNFIKSKF